MARADPPAALLSGPSSPSGSCKGGPRPRRDPHPQLLGDTLPVQVAVLGRDGLQLGHLLFTPLLFVDARVLVVLPELANLLCAAASLELQTDRQTDLSVWEWATGSGVSVQAARTWRRGGPQSDPRCWTCA